MLNFIVHISLRFRGVIIALGCLLLVYGVYRLNQAHYDVFPEFAPPQVDLQTEAPGLSPEQVELLVTQPVENAINGVAHVESLRSSSIQGLSVITVSFAANSDIYQDRQVLAERLTTLRDQLPQGVGAPQMSSLVSSTGDLLSIGLTAAPPQNGKSALSLMDLRSLADWTIKQRVQSVPGIAKASSFGGEVAQFQIQVHSDRLLQYNLSLTDVLNTARLATGIRGAGFIDTPNQRIILQTESQALTPKQLAATSLIQGSGSNVTLNVTLGDVATVVQAPAPVISAGSIQGVPGVVINIWEQYGANTVETTKNVEAVLEELRPALAAQGAVLHTDLFRAANFIDTALGNIKSSLLIGIVLVVIVLFLFLFHFRTAAISCTAIPLSLLAAVAVLDSLGYSLNTMTLGGLAIAIGEVVDDAVIDVENILRRLRENSVKEQPQSSFQVVYHASLEVRSAVVYATLAVILVFVPILTLSGLAGRLFGPLGTAYILAVLASLLVALTITPALCLTLLRAHEIQERETRLVSWLKNQYHFILDRVEKYPRMILIFLIAFTGAGVIIFPFLGGSFLPDLREGHFLVHMTMVPGTSVAESLRVGTHVSEELLKIPFVRSVAQRVGRSESDDTFGPHSSEFEVDLKPMASSEADQAREKIREVFKGFPGASFGINTFLAERVEETISGYTSSVVINLFGTDLDVLDQKAQEIAKMISGISGAVDVEVQSPPGTPQVAIKLHPDKLSYWGFDPVDVLDSISAAYEGNIVGQVYAQGQITDVSVILDQKERSQIVQIGHLRLRNPDGVYVPLSELAEIGESSGRYVILHEAARRVQTITCNFSGTKLSSFVDQIRQNLQSHLALPAGTYFEIGGEAEAQSKSKWDLLLHSLMAGVGIVLLLSLVMHHPRNLLLVLANLPFALVGGVLAVLLSGGEISFGAMVGFVTLFGITLRNSIMMISHFEHLVVVEGSQWNLATAIRGASERLIPVLMTALITAFGLLPLAVNSGKPGVEIEGPMAIVILGGLFTSTVLNLFVLPTLALRFGRFEQTTI